MNGSEASGSGRGQSLKQIEMEFLKSREFAGPEDFQQNPGLARYRSAPSSFLAALLDSPADNGSSDNDSETLFSEIWSGAPDLNHTVEAAGASQMQFHTKAETGRHGLPNGVTSYGGGAVVGSYSVGMENQVQSGGGIDLLRQSSSPAGFFNGFGEVANYRSQGANSSAADASSSRLSFSSGPSLSPRMMLSIPEGNQHSSNDNAHFSHEACLKRNLDGNLKMLSTLNSQIAETGKSLVRHLSLPSRPSNEKGEAATIKFLQFQQDAVPCQIRAKRGCATHPRSIAERVRRTRISEKMNKLQELFPSMDKQTSTADMLDQAVEYIKDLRRQVQRLTDMKAKCVCAPSTSTAV